MKVQIKILIRFSYLSQGGFAASRKGVDAVRHMLYDPARLSRRFAMFEALTLPSLIAQSSHDMQVGVLVGDSFPQAALSHLEQLLAPHDWAQVIQLPLMGQYPAVKEAFNALPTHPQTTHIATMRTDDDDAMHRDLIARTGQIATHMLGFRPPESPFVIAFNRGLFAFLDGAGTRYADVSVRLPIGVGLSLVTPVGHPANIYRRNHRALPQHFDCFTDVSQPMYVRTVHQDNDSSEHDPDAGKTLRRPAAATLLREGFGLDPARLEALG